MDAQIKFADESLQKPDSLKIINNQLRAINALTVMLTNKKCDSNLVPPSLDIQHIQDVIYLRDHKELIGNNCLNIRSMIYELSKVCGQENWFNIIPGCNHRIFGTHFDFISSNLKFSEELCNLLGVFDLVPLGTWGRFKVKLPEVVVPVPSKKQRRVLLIIHCGIQNNIERKRMLEYYINKYRGLFKSRGVVDMFYYDSEHWLQANDYEVRRKSKHFLHWNPYSTVKFASEVYKRFPDSIVMTHPLIASLLLDSNLLFNYACSLDVARKESIQKTFTNVLRWLDSDKTC